MRTFSRNVKPMPEPALTARMRVVAVVGALVMLVLAAGLLYTFAVSWVPWVVLVGLCLVGVVGSHIVDRRMRRMALNRVDEDICTFVRAFERRGSDPWVLRAVYNELQPYCRFRGGMLPLRPDDRFEADLSIDQDELDHIALRAALASWRSVENSERNPFPGRIETVRDLVSFLSLQPRVEHPVA